ncbi:alpha-amylase family glycosyl hydrolase [soil metagenome]
MEFRIARSARDRYALEETLFSTDGDAIVLDAERMAGLARRLAPGDQERQDRIATEVSAIGLIHELGHRAIAVERRTDATAGGPMVRALQASIARLGRSSVGATLLAFESAYPASAVYRGTTSAEAWLERTTGALPAREVALEELALTWVTLQNPAAAPYRELVDDAPLAGTEYPAVVRVLTGADVPPDAADTDRIAPARRLMERLLEPARSAPRSLAAQLRWMRVHWSGWLDPADLDRIDLGLHALEGHEQASFLRHQATAGTAGRDEAAALSRFGGLGDEPEAFSEDRDWMAELVLVAKSTYVWLSQLSKTWERAITRLDQVPDAELDELRTQGFTGLWLIGIWERSDASRSIKQRRGNPEAMASAYSVADYRIAEELGGEAAWADLRDRAAARGLRLAADMVPNHMGMDSRWVLEHPEHFIASSWPPFETYSFEGPDLSPDERVAIVLEDHYWDSTDASVVFKRTDRATGETRYIYHGNDGTSFPWNDTAQLDYLKAEVREAVIGQILDVARRFPVIRFDAAMVLTRHHIQRLWYPLPGHEAGIPSRSEAALPADELERLMPDEFWREVVDRVAAEAPDTLLLAEAFWLLEGYFVRTLGMHRVYNSAFMHMLRDEKNAEYQKVIRETLTFDARILGRYVNFMNNPDERSAIEQFGSQDKYFGVTTLLATLPGLPMFGHGQVEGYAEQYGMEFRTPLLDERPDEGLVARHRREIFPLLHQRWRFAGAAGFRQLVARDEAGEVADVFAYANEAPVAPPGAAERRSLVVFLNRFPRAHVRIAGVSRALGLPADPGDFIIFGDHRSGLHYLREAEHLDAHGLELVLDGYGCHVFLAFEAVNGDGWAELARRLGHAGVADVHEAVSRLREEPLRAAVAAVFSSVAAEAALRPLQAPGPRPDRKADPADLARALEQLARESSSAAAAGPVATSTAAQLERLAKVKPRRVAAALGGWALARAIGDVACDGDPERTAQAFDAWDAAAALGARLRALGFGDADAWRAVELARALLVVPDGALRDAAAGAGLPHTWMEDETVRTAAGWNEWQGQRYLSRESWVELVDALAVRDSAVSTLGSVDVRAAARELKRRAANLGYRLDSAEPAARGAADGAHEPLPADPPRAPNT